MKKHNLNQPVKSLLINSLTTEDFGVYTDSQNAAKVLLFKKLGYQLPMIGGIAGGIAGTAADKRIWIVSYIIKTADNCRIISTGKVVLSAADKRILSGGCII